MKIEKSISQTYYSFLDGQSWCRFTLNEIGDLFIDSDWGYWCYSWRAFGPETFEKFISGLGDDYLIAKLETNQVANGGGRSINKRSVEAIKAHFNALKNHLLAMNYWKLK